MTAIRKIMADIMSERNLILAYKLEV